MPDVSGLQTRADAVAQVMVESLDSPDVAESDEHHLGKVLRIRDGEQVSVVDGQGSWRICSWSKGRLVPSGEIVVEPLPNRRTAVAFPPLKGDRTELVVQKLTKVGVDEIVLLDVDRGIVRWNNEKREKQLLRLSRIAAEAAMQSRRLTLPSVSGPISVAEALRIGFVLSQWGGRAACKDDLRVAVGPEGGWSPGELSAAEEFVVLSGNVLRAETAAITAGVLLQAVDFAS